MKWLNALPALLSIGLAAFVVAETPLGAREAAERVEVDYTVLEAVTDIDAALADDAALASFLSEERDAASHELGVAKDRMREVVGE